MQSVSSQSLFLAILLFFTLEAKTQQFSHEFNNVTEYELNLTEYEKDKQAEAIIIYDMGKSKFIWRNDHFEIAFQRSKKIKIFTEAGLDQGVIEISYYRHENIWEKIEEIEAYTYNEENGIKTRTPLDTKQVYDEKVNDRWSVKKFAMPNVKPGSVIEYKYKLITQARFHLPDWYFQSNIPTLFSEYEVYMVPFYEYTYLLQGASKFDYHTSYVSQGLERILGRVKYQDLVHVYRMEDVPAFRDEEFITSVEDYIIKLDFQMIAWTDVYGIKTEVLTTWPKLVNDLLKNSDFGKYINSSGKLSKKYFDYSLISEKNEEERFNSIIDFIKSNYNWNTYRSFFSHNSASKFATEKQGNSAEINLFLCGMLQEAELQVKPVILSTRDHGKIKVDFPFSQFFNDVIVLVIIDGKNILADATDPYCPNYIIPVRCLNDRGFVIEKNSETWIDLTSQMQSSVRYVFRSSINETVDSIITKVDITSTNYEAVELRKMYQNSYVNLENYFEEKQLTLLDSVQIDNYYEKEKPLKISTEAAYSMEKIGNKLYISPFLEFPVPTNPFKEATRTYPIDRKYPTIHSFFVQFEIPEGYTLEEKPEDLSMKGKLVELEYTATQPSENQIMVKGHYEFKNAVYSSEDYRKLKIYYNQIINKFNEKFVLVKK